MYELFFGLWILHFQFDRLIDWSNDSGIDRLIDWMTLVSIDWLIDWLVQKGFWWISLIFSSRILLDFGICSQEEITKLDQLRTAFVPILNEFYNHGKTAEVIRYLTAASIKPALAPMVAYIAVTHSMDKKASERELTSTLLADLYDALLSEEQFEAAVDQLLTDLKDLELDCPNASELVGNYTARFIADDCLAPKFLEVRQETWRAEADAAKVAGDAGKEAAAAAKAALDTLGKASVLVNMKHGLVRLDNVWGVSGGIRPVKHLIKKMHQILKEYVASSGMWKISRRKKFFKKSKILKVFFTQSHIENGNGNFHEWRVWWNVRNFRKTFMSMTVGSDGRKRTTNQVFSMFLVVFWLETFRWRINWRKSPLWRHHSRFRSFVREK